MKRLLYPAVGLIVIALGPGEEWLAQEADPSATFEIGAGTGQPGEPVTMAFIVNSSSELQAFSLSVDFDEEVLEATSIDQLFARPDGQDWRFWRTFINNANETPGNAGITEG